MATTTKSNNIRLTLALAASVVLTVIVFVLTKDQDRVSVERELFALSDTANISNITITQAGGTHILARQGGGWMLDNTYPVEPSIAQVLLAMLHNVRVFRPVAERQLDSVQQYLQSPDGIEVKVAVGNQLAGHWYVGGSERTGTSYFMDAREQIPYLVHLPGYRSYLAGLFQMPANDWRLRVVASVPYNLLSSIELDYANPAKPDVAIRANESFFFVEGVSPVDTAVMMGYVDQFQYFQTDYFINPGDFARFDSLARTEPLATLTITPLNTASKVSLQLWPLLPNDQFRLAKALPTGDLLLLEENRIRWMLAEPNSFRPRRRPGFGRR